jgi:hypothetical protein
MNARKPTRRKTPPLAYCEYVPPGADNNSQAAMARRTLIEVAKQVFPVFLKTLSTKVFPFYEKLARGGHDLDSVLSYEALTDAGGLKRALAKWADKSNANCPWVMDGALSTLRGWYVALDWRKSLRWSMYPVYTSSGAIGEPFEFSFMRWDTEMWTWSYYSGLLRKQFEEKLSEYERETRKLAESCGLIRAQRKYSPKNFEWFVRHQFAGKSFAEIAKAEYKGKCVSDAASTVRKGIEAAEQLIGWNHPRKPKIGQSRKIR